MTVSGIYEIKSYLSAYRYIGSSQNIDLRWTIHKNDLRRGCHHNRHLQYAWAKYGEDSFGCKLVEESTPGQLLTLEQEWLDRYRQSGLLYNVARNSSAPFKGRHHSKETKAKLSLHFTGKKRKKRKRRPDGYVLTPETRAKMSMAKKAPRDGKSYPLFVNPEKGQFILPGWNLSRLCMQMGLNKKCMWRVQHGQRNHHHGWRLYKQG